MILVWTLLIFNTSGMAAFPGFKTREDCLNAAAQVNKDTEKFMWGGPGTICVGSPHPELVTVSGKGGK